MFIINDQNKLAIPAFRVDMVETLNLQNKRNKYENALFLIESGEFKDIAYRYTKIIHKNNKLMYEVRVDDVFEVKLKHLNIDKFKKVVENILVDLLLTKKIEETISHHYNKIYNY